MNRPILRISGAIVPTDCPIGRSHCCLSDDTVSPDQDLCGRFGRLRSSGDEVVCLDPDDVNARPPEGGRAICKKGPSNG